MKLCKDCKHWNIDPVDRHWEKSDLHICNAIPMFWDATEWNERGNSRRFVKAHENTMAFVQDGSDYKAWLYTRPEFGCVHWEAK